MARLTRPEGRARNRALVLAAARTLFCKQGFHGTTLEAIAEEAGFSKGVIYSQFGSKDDLFLALFEERVQQRLAQMIKLARTAPAGIASLREIADRNLKMQQADVAWTMAAVEFRIHAARSPDLARRYAALHRKVLAGLTQFYELLIARNHLHPRFEPADFAHLGVVLDAGAVLERIVGGSRDSLEIRRRAVWLLLNESAPTTGEETRKKAEEVGL